MSLVSIRVQNIISIHTRGDSPEETLQEYPKVPKKGSGCYMLHDQYPDGAFSLPIHNIDKFFHYNFHDIHV